jgi:hypothetical protein
MLLEEKLNNEENLNEDYFYKEEDYDEEDYDEEDYDEEDYDEENKKDNDKKDKNVDEDKDFDFKFISKQNKHKLDGKHSLERDILFTGKGNDKEEEEESNTSFYNENVSIETGSQYEYESINHQQYINDLHLEKEIFKLLSENTELDFSQNRRKPKREDFNEYYNMLLKNLKSRYTKCEIFVTLSYYFTDNIFNMYKLLDKKHANNIIKELKSKGYLDSLGNINFI